MAGSDGAWRFSRLAIWQTSWEAIRQHPWLGYGPTYHLARIHNESFPHNLFLSAWLYNGVVGWCCS
ncbi:O-antigen ligase family protein [Acetobacter papayae]|uniref:O-antigen ligase family protein n=1 Tax=Acetobacter papayae TaxID=1076592 RepID=UPI0009DECCA4